METGKLLNLRKTELLIEAARLERQLKDTVKGYVTWKKRGNRQYLYLQWRDGQKFLNKKIKEEDLDFYTEKIKERKALEQQLRLNKINLKLIERMIKMEQKTLQCDYLTADNDIIEIKSTENAELILESYREKFENQKESE